MTITIIILIILLSPFLVYLYSRMQMLGWRHGLRDLLKTIKKTDDGKKEK